MNRSPLPHHKTLAFAFMLLALPTAATPAAPLPEGKPSPTNISGQEFPLVLTDNRVIFRLKATDAKSVALNYGQPQPSGNELFRLVFRSASET